MAERIISGWGRTDPVTSSIVTPTSAAALANVVPADGERIARGLGRSYGDAAQLDRGTVVSLTQLRSTSWVDEKAGVLRVGAGVTIGALIDRFVPHGWFVPVTPGTRNVTVGGAIAADIHGKNHHVDGSWGSHVDEITIALADGDVRTASRSHHPDLFWATIGGMGLTGIVLEAVIGLTPIASSTVVVDTERTDNLDRLMERMVESDADYPFSVAWVDLLSRGRSVLTQGRFAEEGDRERPGLFPGRLPSLPVPKVVNTVSVRAFNELWYRMAPSTLSTSHESITRFFHPLDAIADWNRLYGTAGFFQWQIALPEGGDQALREIARRLEAAKAPAFFAVLKRFGPANEAPLSFPMPGWTLALDLPAGRAETRRLLDELDEFVVESGGRVYLAKDARMRAELLPAMYPRLAEWRSARDRYDPNHRFASDLSRRLGL